MIVFLLFCFIQTKMHIVNVFVLYCIFICIINAFVLTIIKKKFFFENSIKMIHSYRITIKDPVIFMNSEPYQVKHCLKYWEDPRLGSHKIARSCKIRLFYDRA